ncbi:hypothetical protein V2J09_011534 [Rumex salicifolius]
MLENYQGTDQAVFSTPPADSPFMLQATTSSERRLRGTGEAATPSRLQTFFSNFDFFKASSMNMGRKSANVYINPKKFGSMTKPCMKEMLTFLSCLALNQVNDEKCLRQKELLGTCMDAQADKNKKPFGTINYHLQRLSRGRK